MIAALSGLPTNSENDYIRPRLAVIRESGLNEKNMLLRGNRSEKANRFLGLRKPRETFEAERRACIRRPHDRPANAAPRRTVCPTIDREQRRRLCFLLR